MQAGLPTYFWPYAIEHFSTSYNISCRLKDGNSPWNLRHAKQFKGLLIPFGAIVDFQQIPERVRAQSKFAPMSIPGIFLGYHLRPGGEWKGEYVCMGIEDLKDIDLAINSAKKHYREQKTMEVTLPKGQEEFKFPLKEKYEVVNRSVLTNEPEALALPEEYECPQFEQNVEDVDESADQAEENEVIDYHLKN